MKRAVATLNAHLAKAEKEEVVSRNIPQTLQTWIYDDSVVQLFLIASS